MSKVRGYVRVSTDWQATSGLGPEAQRDAIRRYFEYKLQPLGAEWVGFYEDPGTSGKVPLRHREAGSRLFLDAEPGDHVVFSKLDRAFRNAKDCLEVVEEATAQGIHLHFLDLQLDTSSYLGKFFLTVLAAFAEMERAKISERTKEGLAVARAKGKMHGKAPYGFKFVGPKGHKRLVPDPYTRALARKFIEFSEQGYSEERIYWWCIQHNIRRRTGGEIGSHVPSMLMRKEKALQEKEKHDGQPTAIDKGAGPEGLHDLPPPRRHGEFTSGVQPGGPHSGNGG